MASSRLKLAAIGVGGIWATHAKNLAAIGGADVVAVCDPSDAQRTRWTTSLNARGYATIDALFEGEAKLDGIIACTPATVRREVIAAATERAVPVLIEKPPAFTLDDAAEILAIVQAASSPVMVGFMYRYLPVLDRVRTLLSGQTINQVQSRFLCPAVTKWKLPPWFLIKERSGGHVLDQAIHVMDLIRYVTGDITEVYTVGTNLLRPKDDSFTIEDSSSTVLRFASGASGTHVHSWAHAEPSGVITWLGKEFRLTLHLDERISGFVGEQTIDETYTAQPEGCSHHHAETVAFLQAIREGASASSELIRSPYTDGVKSLATVLAMNESIESGGPVAVPSVGADETAGAKETQR